MEQDALGRIVGVVGGNENRNGVLFHYPFKKGVALLSRLLLKTRAVLLCKGGDVCLALEKGNSVFCGSPSAEFKVANCLFPSYLMIEVRRK